MFPCFNEKKAVLSFEVFPPKSDSDVSVILNALESFSLLSPDYISVTYGAGGSTKRKTREIAEKIHKIYNINSVAHLTCVDATYESIKEQLDEFKQAGVFNILALRGDLKDNAEYRDFKYATDLIKYINSYGGFNIAAACHPEGHLESNSFNDDIKTLKRKADLGVSHFISQLFFDNEDFYRMLDAMSYASIDTPVQAGIMPVTNAKQIIRMVALSGAKLPPKLTKMIMRFENNPEALKIAGLNYAIEQISELLTNNVRGIHLYTMNNPSTADYIMQNVKPLIDIINK